MKARLPWIATTLAVVAVVADCSKSTTCATAASGVEAGAPRANHKGDAGHQRGVSSDAGSGSDAGRAAGSDTGASDAESGIGSGSDVSDAGSPDSGGSTAPSCDVQGDGTTSCGAALESCCTSLEVVGGTYDRTYTNAGSGPVGAADPATVSGFRLDKYLVTVGRFRQFVKAWSNGARYAPPAGSGKHTSVNKGAGLANSGSPGTYETGWVTSYDASVAPTNDNLACPPTDAGPSPYATWTAAAGARENLPINCVNWYEAYAFCIWDGGFLPSEAEWGYAAAGGGGGEEREYPWGSAALGTQDQYAIYGCLFPSSSASCSTTSPDNLAPVGTAAAGAARWGQLDMAGNVWEWNLDGYSSPYSDPCTDCAYLDPSTQRTLRGGAFSSAPPFMTAWYRGQDVPTDRDYAVGFRCGRTSRAVTASVKGGGVFTARNDPARTGQDVLETELTPANVNGSQFGKVLSLPVDGYVYAQPLFASGVPLPDGSLHDLVFAATEHDSVYAWDAKAGGEVLWRESLAGSGATSIPSADTADPYDLQPEIGITGTPVIDPTSDTLYAVAATKDPGPIYVQRLHALDIATGAERVGSPVVIAASVVNAGGATVTFDPLGHLQRPALLLANGLVYVAFGSLGDVDPYHGWVVAYDAHSLAQSAVYCSTPDGLEGSFWQSGDGLAADSAGAVYGETANGAFDGVTSFGNTAVKLSPSLALTDWFTPHDQAEQSANDLDFGSAGPLLLPDQPGPTPHLAIASGKPGLLYVLDRDRMGHFQPTDDSQIVQIVPVDPNTSVAGQELGIFTTPAYWNGNVYVAPVNGALRQYAFAGGALSTVPTSQSVRIFSFPAPHISISANGATGGVAWAVDGNGAASMKPAVLRAYDATNVALELYGSDAAPGGRDTAGPAVKFTTATVADGRVYVPTQTEITVYGLLP